MDVSGYLSEKYGQKGDRRTARTKRAIVTALFEMMEDRELSSISVTELARRAQIDRKTFYLHYRNIEDVIAGCEDAVVGGLTAVMRNLREPSPEHRHEFFNGVNRFFIENMDFIRLFVRSGAYTYFIQKVGEAFKSEILRILSEDVPDDWSNHDRAVLELGILQMITGVFALYLNWLEDSRGITLEEVGALARDNAVRSLEGMTRSLGIDFAGLERIL
ncbi:MAG: TetR/AcrR family transcriptional regulator [Eubacteriales bacterium]